MARKKSPKNDTRTLLVLLGAIISVSVVVIVVSQIFSGSRKFTQSPDVQASAISRGDDPVSLEGDVSRLENQLR
jgi:hypothetical protein